MPTVGGASIPRVAGRGEPARDGSMSEPTTDWPQAEAMIRGWRDLWFDQGIMQALIDIDRHNRDGANFFDHPNVVRFRELSKEITRIADRVGIDTTDLRVFAGGTVACSDKTKDRAQATVDRLADHCKDRIGPDPLADPLAGLRGVSVAIATSRSGIPSVEELAYRSDPDDPYESSMTLEERRQAMAVSHAGSVRELMPRVVKALREANQTGVFNGTGIESFCALTAEEQTYESVIEHVFSKNENWREPGDDLTRCDVYADAVMKLGDLLAGIRVERTSQVNDDDDPPVNWSDAVTLTQFASIIGVGDGRTAQKHGDDYGLENAGNRQRWRFHIDTLSGPERKRYADILEARASD